VYYVNRDSIESKLACIPDLVRAMSELVSDWQGTLLQGLAQERSLHLAVEIATDVGSSLIDGFIMRDASSYKDGVISRDIAAPLRSLVLLRKPLVQDYISWPREVLHPLTGELPRILTTFSGEVAGYLQQELGKA
jgi:uncharacterized protein YutE (UPF0331/DUF86 family)